MEQFEARDPSPSASIGVACAAPWPTVPNDWSNAMASAYVRCNFSPKWASRLSEIGNLKSLVEFISCVTAAGVASCRDLVAAYMLHFAWKRITLRASFSHSIAHGLTLPLRELAAVIS